MAGCSAVVTSGRREKDAFVATTVLRGRWQWKVSYARFFPHADSTFSATCPSLVPLTRSQRNRPPRGTWISSSSSAVSVLIIKDESSSGTILTVDLGGKILEEHYISKLNFSWPQMSCVPGFPARGSKAIFASYKDSASQIQKFGLQFPTSSEVETFVAALKENLEIPMEMEPQKSDHGSEISTQSQFTSSSGQPLRQCNEPLNALIPLNSYAPEMPLSASYEVEQLSCTQEIVQIQRSKGISPSLPPSFTSLLSTCFSETRQGIDSTRTTPNQEIDLKSQIVKYMEDSAFQDMLQKVEKVINEIEGDMML